jgi:hypothetical protein
VNGQASATASAADSATPVSPFENRPLPELDDLNDNPEQSAPVALAAATGLAAGRAVAVSPFNSGVVLLGTAGRGIYRLSGSSWVASNLTAGSVYNLIFDRSTPGRALAAVDVASGGLLVTADNGQTWQPISTGLSGRTVYSLAQHAQNGLIFLAGTDAGVYQSADGGLSWSQVGLPGMTVKAVNLRSGPNDLYLAGTDIAVYYSYASSPTTWTQLDPIFNNIGIQGILQYPGSKSYFFFTRLGGVVRLDLQ